MREYEVTVPIAGHAIIVVIANSEEEAKDMAIDQVNLDHIESWEPMKQFNQGNVCYFPAPWEIEAIDVGEVEE